MKKIFASRRHSRMSADWHMSPVVDTGDYVFFSGVTAAGPNGDAPSDPETQFRTAFEYLGENLEAAGMSFKNVVDLTSYHVDLQKHKDAFVRIKDEFVSGPYPTWTAIGVSQLWYPGLLVELRIIARRQQRNRGERTMAKKTSDRVSSIAAATIDMGKAAEKKVRSLAGSILGRRKVKKAAKARPAKRRATKGAKKQ